jgi:ribosomal protein L11 methylase PrmA
LREDGVLIASGILDDDVVDVTSALRSAGMRVTSRDDDGPWVCLRLRREA